MEVIPGLAILGPDFEHYAAWRHQDLEKLQSLLLREVN